LVVIQQHSASHSHCVCHSTALYLSSHRRCFPSFVISPRLTVVIPPQVESELRIYGECNAETVTLLLISPRLTVVVPPQVESKLRTFEEAYSEVTFLTFDF
jgi:hypothetical protein